MTFTRTLCPTKLARIMAIAGSATAVLFDAEADVLRLAQVADTSGGFLDTFAAVLTDVPCAFRKSIVTPRERESSVLIRSIAYWDFTFPTGTDIQQTDRLRVGGRIFEVVGAGEDSARIILRVTAMEII